MTRGFLDFLAKMGLSVRDDPPKVVDLTVRAWGEAQGGLTLSVREIPREDRDALPRVSVVIRNVEQEDRCFEAPGWLQFYEVKITLPDGSRAAMGPFGRASLVSERRVERLEVALRPGEFREAEIPIGSLFHLQARGRYRVAVACEPVLGCTLTSNEIAIG